MKQKILAALIASLTICASSAAQSVSAGSAPLTQALTTLVPLPFKVNIDRRIPATTILQWSESSDWMIALQKALATGNLRSYPRWDVGQIDVMPIPKEEAPILVASAAAAGSSLGMVTTVDATSTPPLTQIQVSPSDKTIREALVRISKENGWLHSPEHWTVTVDLPILASATLGADFRDAVRNLLSSTELTNMPLQPCFYSNHVLRVVPKAELCNKSAN